MCKIARFAKQIKGRGERPLSNELLFRSTPQIIVNVIRNYMDLRVNEVVKSALTRGDLSVVS